MRLVRHPLKVGFVLALSALLGLVAPGAPRAQAAWAEPGDPSELAPEAHGTSCSVSTTLAFNEPLTTGSARVIFGVCSYSSVNNYASRLGRVLAEGLTEANIQLIEFISGGLSNGPYFGTNINFGDVDDFESGPCDGVAYCSWFRLVGRRGASQSSGYTFTTTAVSVRLLLNSTVNGLNCTITCQSTVNASGTTPIPELTQTVRFGVGVFWPADPPRYYWEEAYQGEDPYASYVCGTDGLSVGDPLFPPDPARPMVKRFVALETWPPSFGWSSEIGNVPPGGGVLVELDLDPAYSDVEYRWADEDDNAWRPLGLADDELSYLAVVERPANMPTTTSGALQFRCNEPGGGIGPLYSAAAQRAALSNIVTYSPFTASEPWSGGECRKLKTGGFPLSGYPTSTPFTDATIEAMEDVSGVVKVTVSHMGEDPATFTFEDLEVADGPQAMSPIDVDTRYDWLRVMVECTDQDGNRWTLKGSRYGGGMNDEANREEACMEGYELDLHPKTWAPYLLRAGTCALRFLFIPDVSLAELLDVTYDPNGLLVLDDESLWYPVQEVVATIALAGEHAAVADGELGSCPVVIPWGQNLVPGEADGTEGRTIVTNSGLSDGNLVNTQMCGAGWSSGAYRVTRSGSALAAGIGGVFMCARFARSIGAK